MNSKPRLQEQFPILGLFAKITTGWATWFMDVWRALSGWNNSFTITQTLNFPLIAANSQSSLNITIDGARSGDFVAVQPGIFIAGIVFNGYVISDNTISVVASNITTGAIDPASTNFRIIILQN